MLAGPRVPPFSAKLARAAFVCWPNAWPAANVRIAWQPRRGDWNHQGTICQLLWYMIFSCRLQITGRFKKAGWDSGGGGSGDAVCDCAAGRSIFNGRECTPGACYSPP